ncbi:MAG: TMEM175 family protein [Parafilimonas sp.]
MSETVKESLEKEFELERMILFSDAVFAIAITLLILEIKFPELPENFDNISVLNFFKPTLIHFLAFMISFFFIGSSWARHLTLCKFLKQYNNTVIFYNLLLLFFIVTFPFSISAFIDNINGAFIVAIGIYLSNILFVVFAQFLFVHYILKTNTALSTPGSEDEKLYFYIKAKYSLVMITASIAVMIIVAIISKGNLLAVAFSLYVLPLFALVIKRKVKKYKPKNLKSVNSAIN